MCFRIVQYAFRLGEITTQRLWLLFQGPHDQAGLGDQAGRGSSSPETCRYDLSFRTADHYYGIRLNFKLVDHIVETVGQFG